MKAILRGIRCSIKRNFISYKHISKGKEHWDAPKWLQRVRKYVEEVLHMDLSEKDIAHLALLINPAFGETIKKQANNTIKDLIGEKGFALFHRIFENNTRSEVKEFFSHSLI